MIESLQSPSKDGRYKSKRKNRTSCLDIALPDEDNRIIADDFLDTEDEAVVISENHEMSLEGADPEPVSEKPKEPAVAKEEPVKTENIPLPINTPQEVRDTINKLDKKIKHTDKALNKAKKVKEKNANRIKKSKSEIIETREDNLELAVLIETIEPKAKEILKKIVSETQHASNDISEKLYINETMHTEFNVSREALRIYLHKLSEIELIKILNVHPYKRSRKSRKFRIIQCETSLKEKLTRLL